MSKKKALGKSTLSSFGIKLETISKQIARIERGEGTSKMTLEELKAIRDELLVEING